MARHVLPETKIHPAIQRKVSDNHRDLVEEAIAAVEKNDVVVLGMAQNPFCKRACKALRAKGIPFVYIEKGSYLSEWRRRNALKMWTGWPTFPMVFVKGVLVGGAEELQALIDSHELDRMLQG